MADPLGAGVQWGKDGVGIVPTKSKKDKPRAHVGWSTLNEADVLQSVSNGLRQYKLNRPELNLESRRYKLEDGVTQWQMRSNGVPLCNIVVRANRKGGVRLGYELPERVTKDMRQLIEHEAKQLHEHIKIRIDADNNVGTHWEITGIPKNLKTRIQWYKAWKDIKEYRRSCKREGYKPTLADIVDFFKYADDKDTPYFSESTLKKIIRVGEDGVLDNFKSY